MRTYKRTCLEEQMFTFLTRLGFVKNVHFSEQFATRSGYVIDFAFPDLKVAVETDGIIWHSAPRQRQRDGFRDMRLRKAGWKILRFGEIFTVDEVKERLAENGVCLPL